MGLAGRNQLLATTDFPTGQSLGKQYFTAAQTAGTEHPLGKEPAHKKDSFFFFFDKLVTHHNFSLSSLSLFCLKIIFVLVTNQILFQIATGK